MKNSFVVVDLETTNANWHDNGRIIQFGCAIIEEGEITSLINQKINPQVPISSRISALTGITDDDVKDSPIFEDIAPDIFKLLKNKIFIAHNVNFDLTFLNREFQRVGLNELNIKAIDTVELSQILFPTLSSYKLQDLTSYLKIEHNNPHSADSDALVTAELFQTLQERLRSLPRTTIETLAKLGKDTIRDTNIVFKQALEETSDNVPLRDYLYEKNGLVLRKKDLHITDYIHKNNHFPDTTKKKQLLFNKKIEYRSNQVELMDFIYKLSNSRNKKQKWNIIEAPTGSGKTLGYLLPLSYVTNNNQKLIVATSTRVLQQQILDEAIPLLNDITGNNYHAEIVKSSYNYIDLDRFFDALQSYESHGHTALIEMKIIVWLTMTTTGDLGELKLTNYNNPFFSLIRHHKELNENTLFADDDFWKFQQNKFKESNILLTNQAFLARNVDMDYWGQNSYLVVDEANHFAQSVRDANSPVIKFYQINEYIKKISDILYQNRNTLKFAFDQSPTKIWSSKDLSEFEEHFQDINNLMERIEFNIFENYIQSHVKLNDRERDVSIVNNSQKFGKKNEHLTEMLVSLQGHLNFISKRIDQLFDQYSSQKNFISIELSRIISSLVIENEKLLTPISYIDELIQQIENRSGKFGVELQMSNFYDPKTIEVSWKQYDIKKPLQQIESRFSQIINIGAALSIQNSFDFFISDLQLRETRINKTLILNDTNHIDQNLKIYLPDNLKDINDLNNDEYYRMIANYIIDLLKNVDRQTMILFNSLNTLKNVYFKLLEGNLEEEWELLAQDVTGSPEKIKKRFALGNRAVLLGANSFWEGVDFPDKLLEIIVITRIPFESPEQPDVKIRNDILKKKKQNVFLVDTLPRAILQFRQGIGRLIRTPTDKGIILMLDNRLTSTNYGDTILKSIPKNVDVETKSMDSIKKDINKFLN
ncbi:helicase C-terminal domain-containing protein [Lactobacillus terrae]|uniref:helicase C-terminal domain-containing protein n=1 Tax=Lactobacillus terrae TaxID=2269374 RepID=UPI000C1B7A43|nr:helicase C-terminal domain-containing protein [Lactobacillus terrae]